MAAVKIRSFFGGDLFPSIYALFASVDASVGVSIPSFHHCHSQTTHQLLQPLDVDNTPTRVEELWFSDGGLVVQAEQSLYRVSGKCQAPFWLLGPQFSRTCSPSHSLRMLRPSTDVLL
jgi:hypothetical protein